MREGKRVTGYRLRVTKTGFTLVEILVATTILVIAMASIYVSFKGGVTSWTKGSARMERYLNARAALDMMSREISSALIAASSLYDISFVGRDNYNGSNTDRLDFVCIQAPTTGYKSDLCEIAYYWDSTNNDNSLNRRISRDPNLSNCTAGGGYDDLARNITDLEFQYYHGGDWRNEWESASASPSGTRIVAGTSSYAGDEQNNLPQAVKITITIQDELQQEGGQKFSTIVYLPTSR